MFCQLVCSFFKKSLDEDANTINLIPSTSSTEFITTTLRSVSTGIAVSQVGTKVII